jgi:hypothetical protein
MDPVTGVSQIESKRRPGFIKHWINVGLEFLEIEIRFWGHM